MTERLTDLVRAGLERPVSAEARVLANELAAESGTAVVAVLGWIFGLVLTWGFFSLLKNNLYEPNGVYLELSDLAPVWFSALIPIATVFFPATIQSLKNMKQVLPRLVILYTVAMHIRGR